MKQNSRHNTPPRLSTSLLVTASLIGAVFMAPQAFAEQSKPKLVVQITVDGLRADSLSVISTTSLMVGFATSWMKVSTTKMRTINTPIQRRLLGTYPSRQVLRHRYTVCR